MALVWIEVIESVTTMTKRLVIKHDAREVLETIQQQPFEVLEQVGELRSAQLSAWGFTLPGQCSLFHGIRASLI